MSGAVRETYAAALQHDLADLPDGATPVGVVRRPTGWFRALVDENVPAVAPPEALLDECKARHEELKRRGMCDEGAHNAAWEDVKFADRYRDYLEADDEATAALDGLAERVRDGETLALVCFEGKNKRCHRHLLREAIRERVDGSAVDR
jgi:uncharacterized protein YeaO (DUF488 family)